MSHSEMSSHNSQEVPRAQIADITDADVDAYLHTMEDDPATAHSLGFGVILDRNPDLALRLLKLEAAMAQGGKPLDPFVVMGMMAIHQNNKGLEQMTAAQPT